VIDASVALLARDGDDIYTSDPEDMRRLVEATGTHVELIPICCAQEHGHLRMEGGDHLEVTHVQACARQPVEDRPG
jgi:hypothetical protein